MTLVLIIAALLACAALAAVLVSLLKTEKESSTPSQPARRDPLGEIGRRSVWMATSVGGALVMLSIGLYLLLGTPAALTPSPDPVGSQQNRQAAQQQQIQATVAKLAERVRDNPADGEGWLMLGRAYNALGRFAEASAAFGRATTLLPENAELLADYADTLAMAQGRRLLGEPEQIIKRALSIDPRNIKALALSGSVAFEHQDYTGAIAEWRKILAMVPADSSAATSMRNSIADAEARTAARRQ